MTRLVPTERLPVTLLWQGGDSDKHTDTGAHVQMQILVFQVGVALFLNFGSSSFFLFYSLYILWSAL